MKELMLIRHAESEGASARDIGRTDVPLTARGRGQAEAVARRLAAFRPGEIWTSPSRRAIETLGGEAGHACRVVCQPDLREVDFGRWEGLSFREIQARDPGLIAAWAEQKPEFSFPGGESVAEFVGRVRRVAAAVEASPEGRLAIVTHGGVVRFLLCVLFRLPFERAFMFDVRPAAVITLRLDGGYALLTGLEPGGDE